ncbi:MAG: flagellar hook-length control protein FliK [Notoacmeibacter sp.]
MDQDQPSISTALRCKSVLVEHITRNSTGVITHIELALEPAELGRINARIEQNQGQLVLIVSAESSQLAEEIAQDSGLLLRALGSHISGIETMSVIVRQEGNSGSTSGQSAMIDFGSNKYRDQGFKQNKPAFGTEQPEQFLGIDNAHSNTTKTRVFI